MRTIDLSPLHRFAIGFDHMQRQLDQLSRLESADVAYPPYNIEALGENDYRITMAVAGFGEADLDITLENSHLIVAGRTSHDDAPREYLHRGIATRAFERRFELADHLKIKGARLNNGLLHVDLVREVPEALKPRKIAIETASPTATPKAIAHKAA